MKLMAPLLDWYAPRYQREVGAMLKKHGLRYEDLYDPLLNQACFAMPLSLVLPERWHALASIHFPIQHYRSFLAPRQSGNHMREVSAHYHGVKNSDPSL